jgi:hypothetical protein
VTPKRQRQRNFQRIHLQNSIPGAMADNPPKHQSHYRRLKEKR